ncbi:unnamed protein product [Prorocentrum cordatum]|uniref:Uncharacterized protein n=1 Tax=Prorocentrum cordatum TaxID=2364126 RepID=A0ABN9QSQ4_9DINO|nr:unnamed protein product [Polarella glacialis]
MGRKDPSEAAGFKATGRPGILELFAGLAVLAEPFRVGAPTWSEAWGVDYGQECDLLRKPYLARLMLRKVKDGALMALVAIEACLLALTLGVFFALENPIDSLIWLLPEMQVLRGDAPCGAKWAKLACLGPSALRKTIVEVAREAAPAGVCRPLPLHLRRAARRPAPPPAAERADIDRWATAFTGRREVDDDANRRKIEEAKRFLQGAQRQGTSFDTRAERDAAMANCLSSLCYLRLSSVDVGNAVFFGFLRVGEGHRGEMPQAARALESQLRAAAQGEGKPLDRSPIARVAMCLLEQGRVHEGETLKAGRDQEVAVRFQFARAIQKATAQIARESGLISPPSAAAFRKRTSACDAHSGAADFVESGQTLEAARRRGRWKSSAAVQRRTKQRELVRHRARAGSTIDDKGGKFWVDPAGELRRVLQDAPARGRDDLRAALLHELGRARRPGDAERFASGSAAGGGAPEDPRQPDAGARGKRQNRKRRSG